MSSTVRCLSLLPLLAGHTDISRVQSGPLMISPSGQTQQLTISQLSISPNVAKEIELSLSAKDLYALAHYDLIDDRD